MDDFQIETVTDYFPKHVLVKYHGSGGDVTVPEGVTEIGKQAFAGCTGLTSVILPDSADWIERHAFAGCTGLTSVTFPDEMRSIEANAFANCTGLTSVTLPDGIEEIRRRTFFRCSGLTSVTIPDSVEVIWQLAFAGCSGLTSITIPESVVRIYREAFIGCTGLTSVTVQGICFDQETLGHLQETWGVEPHEVIQGFYPTAGTNELGIVPPHIRYPVRWTAFTQHPEHEKNTQEILRILSGLAAFFIDREDIAVLQELLGNALLQDGIRQNIDDWIDCAIEHEKLDAQLLLTNYKAEKIGYTDPTDHLQL
ncbi:MAG: leucine-rich repeat domain-containing protein [Oscillospiraceae bacterium]|nr:leucine-rich repeat domain-containing protein [Oscillospiraceae bacterium]